MSLEHSPARNGQGFGNGVEPFVTEREAAKFLGLAVRTLQRWRTEPPTGGAPIFFKLGAKRIAYRLSDLTKWAEGRAFTSTSEVDTAA
ncbi:MAG: helix-turn-helix domain-containing protein [Rhodospirillales bacterium]|jgi:predicted DNA-binding transcriptional regulator AlpA|nr:helix-turn-helix domain-containing protein [Rhodospirillales bacterium]